MNTKNSLAILAFFVAILPLPAQDNRFVVFGGGKHGYIDQDGKVVIPIKLEGTYVLDFSEGYAAFAEPAKPEPIGVPYLDKNGKLHLSRQEKWGFIDQNGAVAIDPQFDGVQDFSEGLAAVAFNTEQTQYNCVDCDPNDHWGFIDKTGKMVVQPQYHSARPFSEGLAAVEDDEGKWGYIDAKGDLVIPCIFKLARKFSGGLAAAAISEKVGYIDKQGEFVIKPRFAIVGDFFDGLAAVRTGGKTAFMMTGPAGGTWTFIGKDGKKRFMLPRGTERVEDLAEGLTAFELEDSHCGYVNESGVIVIAPKFSYCDAFSDGLADVLNNGKWQYIDKNANVILSVPYEQVDSFKHGLAAVAEGPDGGQKFGYINKNGKVIWKPQPAL
jgi:hypothetical protein